VQTTAAVNHGNSGGPMMLAGSGQVVGLVDLLTTGQVKREAWAVSAKFARHQLGLWASAPQPIPLVSCTAQRQQASYARRVAGILELSSAGRGNVGIVVAQVKIGKIALSEGALQMKTTIANRQAVLLQIKKLPPAPAGYAALPTALAGAVQASLEADQAYRTWMIDLPNDAAFKKNHQAWQNQEWQDAQRLSGDATRAKDTFVALYNPIATSFGLPLWSSSAF
jgi:hypothetical protein